MAITHFTKKQQFLISSIFALIACASALYFWRTAGAPVSDSTAITQVQLRGSGFDLQNLTIPANEIQSGGPPKDGIPAISAPEFVRPERASFLQPDDRVVGITIDGKSRAYPLKILTQHEIVNDSLGGVPIAVTYCPLCDSVVVFDRRTPLGEREFGVSGLLYNSNVLMYDRSERPSLWSQMKMEGVSGAAAGKRLTVLPMELTTWNSWLERNPNTEVLSIDTGYARDYRQNPYVSYFSQPGLMFPVRPLSQSLPLKEPVLGIWDAEVAIAIPASIFRGGDERFSRELNGKSFEIEFDADEQAVRVVNAAESLNWVNSFWFAWYAFRPDTQLLKK